MTGLGGNPFSAVGRTVIPFTDMVTDITRYEPTYGDHKAYLLYMALVMTAATNPKVIHTVLASVGGYLLGVNQSAGTMKTKGDVKKIRMKTNGVLDTEPRTTTALTYDIVKPMDPEFPEISATDMQEYVDVTEEELGGLFAMYFYAIGKQPNGSDMRTFNQSRQKAIAALVDAETLQIFVNDSAFITPEIMMSIHKSFALLTAVRANILLPIVQQLGQATTPAGAVFQRLFMLNAGNGISIVYMAQITLEAFPGFFDTFPELHSELVALKDGLERINRLDVSIREYCKYIYGADFVPIDPGKTRQLLAVLRITATAINPTYKDFGGPEPAPNLKKKADELVSDWVAPEARGTGDFGLAPAAGGA